MIGGRRKVAALAGRDQVVEQRQPPEAEIERHVDERALRGQRICIERRAQPSQTGQHHPFDVDRGEIGREAGRQDEIGRALQRRGRVSGGLRPHLLEGGTDLRRSRAPSRRAMLPGQREGGAGIGEAMTDPGPDPAARGDVHLAPEAFPSDDLGAEGARGGRGRARGAEVIVDRDLGHAPVSAGPASGCAQFVHATNATRKSATGAGRGAKTLSGPPGVK